jgi:hypothetical protein
MNDQIGGQSDKDSTPESGADALFGQTRAAPVIQGEAVEVPTEQSASETAPEQTAAEPTSEPAPAGPTPGESAPPEPAAAETPRKNGLLRPLAALLALGALGGGGYYGWSTFIAPTPSPTKMTATLKSPETKPSVEPAAEKSASTTVPPATEAKDALPKSAATAPEEPAKAAETKAGIETTAQKSASPAEPIAAAASGSSEAMKKAEASAEKEKAATTKAEEARLADTSVSVAKEPGAEPKADKALAEMTSRLEAAQAALDRLGQRLQAVESQLAAPKTDMRAPLAAREAGSAKDVDASARIVVAQSLLTALRQGDDYATMLTALQNLGGDPGRIARLRAGLAAPSAARLATEFVALAPKILAASAPTEAPPQEAKAPQNLGETILTFVETRARKLVRIRPAGAPDGDETARRVKRIEKDLARGDIAAALAERAQLPAPTQTLTADWASGAQARLDAEEAAKAELTAALQALTKSKS